MSPSEELTELEELALAECAAYLAKAYVGRIGFIHEERPQVLPVNYVADRDGNVVFRTGEQSILTGVAGQKVVFEVDGLDPGHRCGWSVCVHGVGHEVTDDHPMAARLRGLHVITWAPGRRDRLFVVIPSALTGRRIPVNLSSEEGWFPGIPAS